MWGVELSIVVLMVAINGVFAAYEIALASIGLARLDTLVREQRRGAAAALRMKEKMEASLAIVQLGITLVGVIAGATGGSGAEQSLEPILHNAGLSTGMARFVALALVVVPLTVLTLICGELVPKVFALRNSERVCLQLSPIMEWFALSARPVVWFLETSVRRIMDWGQRRWPRGEGADPTAAPLQELRAIAAMARTSRLIGVREEGIIVNAARLSHTPVRAIMLAATDVSMLCIDDSMEACLIAAHHDLHTRFPVTERRGDPQAILGYVNFKDIIAAMRLSPRDSSLRGILRPLVAFRSEQTVAACLEQMILGRNHIALVHDGEGTIVGMITLEDILEELIGEIHDEYDRLPAHITRAGTGWVIGGHASLPAIRERTGLAFAFENEHGSPPPTLTDWIERQLDGPVQGGEIVHTGDLRAVVRKVRRQHVYEAQVSRSASPSEPPMPHVSATQNERTAPSAAIGRDFAGN